MADESEAVVEERKGRSEMEVLIGDGGWVHHVAGRAQLAKRFSGPTPSCERPSGDLLLLPGVLVLLPILR